MYGTDPRYLIALDAVRANWLCRCWFAAKLVGVIDLRIDAPERLLRSRTERC